MGLFTCCKNFYPRITVSTFSEFNRYFCNIPGAGAIAADKELTRQIQIRLIDLGLLDPPADGIFGSVSPVALNGEWFASGYNNHANGAYLYYCYNLIRRIDMADGNFRVYFISK
ncbi:hypothetical protein QUB77_14185 [Microcoleus sp. AT9b-C3]